MPPTISVGVGECATPAWSEARSVGEPGRAGRRYVPGVLQYDYSNGTLGGSEPLGRSVGIRRHPDAAGAARIPDRRG